MNRIFGKNMTKSDIWVSFLVVTIIALIIIPLPSVLLDILIVINLTLAMNVLLITLFTKSVLEFSSFPTLLLFTTMYKLGLNLASTRLILTDGSAGQVISAFANVVTGSNYIVGIILFIIIMIVQLAVVTNGTGRVAEVAARFTLDAMPGKQMAIDSDLNSGLIDEKTARRKREDLQREADFYGSMDGASKFVKGDAIASILIVLINLIGGPIIFTVNGSLSITQALSQFGKLSIGDGLVSAIPSLLISIATGVIVTRSDNEQSFGSTLSADLLRNPQLFRIIAVILLVLSVVSGFPFIPFASIGIALFFISSLIEKGATKTLLKQKEKAQKLELEKKKSSHQVKQSVSSFQVDPLAIEIGYGLISLVDSSVDNSLMDRIVSIRQQIAKELGILIGPVRIKDNLYLESNEYSIKVRGNEVTKGKVYPDKFMIIAQGNDKFPFQGIKTKDPTFHLDALWIDARDKEKAELQNYTIIEPLTVIATHLKDIITKHATELLGRQEVKKLLEGIKEQSGVVIDELIPDIMRLGEVQKVLQNLLAEQIPINDLTVILETLADYGNITKDTEVLTEYVRQALKRTIAAKYAGESQLINIVTIHPRVEEMVAQNIQKTPTGSYPILKSEAVNQILRAVGKVQQELVMKNTNFVILASPKIRLVFRKLISMNYPDIAVLSLNEIPNEVKIQTVGSIDF
ncbi:flagellar biosynthesis protein FlhA [Liquorilactobacillus vini]|uniref:Flagellar biosynthesis protein FlhA n=2 Tax=Liquorilactobacillus vini DSM 20605 TaxID=1133569 RepID=A0A0A7RMG6_9LACO|nr:flagellar biosynthesis protein FlhA [Liquorilactobacillus vini]AJA34488.1 flagellar biosynthesis protein FlhA [Liquorilactobacillus vini DSM 20605]